MVKSEEKGPIPSSQVTRRVVLETFHIVGSVLQQASMLLQRPDVTYEDLHGLYDNRKRRMKDASATSSRAKSAFLVFCDDHRPRLKEREAKMSLPEQTRILSAQWAALADADRKIYIDRARAAAGQQQAAAAGQTAAAGMAGMDPALAALASSSAGLAAMLVPEGEGRKRGVGEDEARKKKSKSDLVQADAAALSAAHVGVPSLPATESLVGTVGSSSASLSEDEEKRKRKKKKKEGEDDVPGLADDMH